MTLWPLWWLAWCWGPDRIAAFYRRRFPEDSRDREHINSLSSLSLLLFIGVFVALCSVPLAVRAWGFSGLWGIDLALLAVLFVMIASVAVERARRRLEAEVPHLFAPWWAQMFATVRNIRPNAKILETWRCGVCGKTNDAAVHVDEQPPRRRWRSWREIFERLRRRVPNRGPVATPPSPNVSAAAHAADLRWRSSSR